MKKLGEMAEGKELSKNEQGLVERSKKFLKEAEFYQKAINKCMTADPSYPMGHPKCNELIGYPTPPAPSKPNCPKAP